MERGAFKLLNKMERSWWYRGRICVLRSALSRARVRSADEILDYGAGFGGMHDALAELGAHVDAYEPDGEAAAAAEGRGYGQIFSSDADALARTYDLIGLFDVVEHIEHDREFLTKAYGAIRAGGHIAITVPAFPFLWSIHDVSHHHFRRYTKASMRAALYDAGFQVEYASYWNMLLFIPAALMRFLGWSGESALLMPRSLNAIFFKIVKAESFLMRFLPLPFGTGLVVIARKK